MVDLPDPLAPTSAQCRPASSTKLTSLKTGCSVPGYVKLTPANSIDLNGSSGARRVSERGVSAIAENAVRSTKNSRCWESREVINTSSIVTRRSACRSAMVDAA